MHSPETRNTRQFGAAGLEMYAKIHDNLPIPMTPASKYTTKHDMSIIRTPSKTEKLEKSMVRDLKLTFKIDTEIASRFQNLNFYT